MTEEQQGAMVSFYFVCIQRYYNLTWSGKSKPGIRKIPLRDFPSINDLIFAIASRIHANYKKELCRNDLVEKILKFAYELVNLYVYVLNSIY